MTLGPPSELVLNSINKPMKKIILAALFILLLCVLAILLRPETSTAQGGGDPPDLILQVTVNRPAHQSTRQLDSIDERIALDPQELATIDVQLSPGSGTIRLLAPNGGAINNGDGKLSVVTTEATRNITFSFKPGTSRGLYTVELCDGQRTQTLQMWAGPEPPLGQPGPTLTFTPAP